MTERIHASKGDAPCSATVGTKSAFDAPEKGGHGFGPGWGHGRGYGCGPGRRRELPSSGRSPAGSQLLTIAVVDQERRTGCGICVAMCPAGVISIDMAATVDPGFCSGCGAGVPECPDEALALVDTLLERGFPE